MKSRRRLVPVLLLGVLSLATGLGAWLGASERPVSHTASGFVSTCSTSLTKDQVDISCMFSPSLGTDVSFQRPRGFSEGDLSCLAAAVDRSHPKNDPALQEVLIANGRLCLG